MNGVADEAGGRFAARAGEGAEPLWWLARGMQWQGAEVAMQGQQEERLRRRRELVRQSTRDLYGLLAKLGEKLYLEAMCLCDDEQAAAAWASAILVRSLEEKQLLARLESAP